MSEYFSPTNYKGSATLKTSVANAEILPTPPITDTLPYSFRKLSIMNFTACTLIANGVEIYLSANLGFSIDESDIPLTSLKIKEGSITYTWFGEY